MKPRLSLLIGCRELRRMGGFNSIMEGDFFIYSMGLGEGYSSLENSRLGRGGYFESLWFFFSAYS